MADVEEQASVDALEAKKEAERAKILGIDETKILAEMPEDELQDLLCDIADMDPDNTMLPVGHRQRDQTKKEPTGPLDREKLMDSLEETAIAIPDKDEEVPFVPGTKKGKVFKQKEKVSSDNPYALENGASAGDNLEPEVKQALENATDLELTDLAAVLGLYKMLNNQQFYDAQGAGDQMVCTESWKDNTLCKLPLAPLDDEPNAIDVEAALEQVKKNDSSLTELNLNNVYNIQIETIVVFCEALKSNTSVKSFSIANTKSTDVVAQALAAVLCQNSTLTTLNIETNFITTEGMLAIVEALSANTTLSEIRFANQRQKLAGKFEDSLKNVLEDNTSIKKLGYQFSCPGPRHICGQLITRNVDLARQKRTGKA
ncbi:unnamed protein product [Oikopleura dioica]|uniref:Tropomodulin n=1 Tax=Oikopleura dioica TaxID=34765 RepID=E4Y9J5_OIKDI|nr:unnamed protein product [Oikopleura dioica]